MRHRVGHRKLGRVTGHRIAMLRNQAEALLRHERIRTTVPKAKELRPFVERLITIAKRGLARGGDNGGLLQARRLVLRDIPDRDVVSKLFDQIAPRFTERPGGYTRLLRVGLRRGDAAEVAQIELVGSEYDPKGKTEPTDKAAAPEERQGVGTRLRAAASRLRGRKAKAEPEQDAGESKEAPTKRARATPKKKKTTARKKGK